MLTFSWDTYWHRSTKKSKMCKINLNEGGFIISKELLNYFNNIVEVIFWFSFFN